MKLPVTAIDGKSKKRAIPVGSYQPVEDLKNSRLIFSFEILDLNHEYFNLGGTCQKWFVTMFTKLNEISNIPFGELTSQKYRTFRFHSHEDEKISVEFPFNLDKSQTRQIRFGTGQGGIHGILVDNMFYVLWLDRHHNLYPSKKHGGIKTFEKENECCGYNIETIKSLQDEIETLKQEIEAYEEVFQEVATSKEV